MNARLEKKVFLKHYVKLKSDLEIYNSGGRPETPMYSPSGLMDDEKMQDFLDELEQELNEVRDHLRALQK